MSDQKCAVTDCETTLNPDDDYCQWSDVLEDYLCEGCYESDLQSASTLYLIGSPKGPRKLYIGDHVRIDEYGDPLYGETDVVESREWRSSSAWRGYYHTTLKGHVEVLDGWTTGDWDDAVGRRKRTFNEWVEQAVEGEIDSPVPFALLFEPTSNVFSTGVSVLVKEEDYDAFVRHLNEGTLITLHDSLS